MLWRGVGIHNTRSMSWLLKALMKARASQLSKPCGIHYVASLIFGVALTRDERSFTYGTRTPRSRWCSHAPRHIAQPVSLALLHRHCTTGTAPLALHHGSLATWRTTLDAQHDRLHSMHDTSRRPHCALSLCRLLPSTISAHHNAFPITNGLQSGRPPE
jgi:hypothetical protein